MSAPETTIIDGAYNRLTSSTNGILVTSAATDYAWCAINGGVVKYAGQVSLEPDELVEWARPGLAEGPIVLITVPGDEAATDKRRAVLSTFQIAIYVAMAAYDDEYEAAGGDVAGATRKPGVWEVKDYILDLLLGNALCSVIIDTVTYWYAIPEYMGSELVATDDGIALLEIRMEAECLRRHGLTAWEDLDVLEGVDFTLTKEPATVGEEFEAGFDLDVP